MSGTNQHAIDAQDASRRRWSRGDFYPLDASPEWEPGVNRYANAQVRRMRREWRDQDERRRG